MACSAAPSGPCSAASPSFSGQHVLGPEAGVDPFEPVEAPSSRIVLRFLTPTRLKSNAHLQTL
jgi:hypothetical protein